MFTKLDGCTHRHGSRVDVTRRPIGQQAAESARGRVRNAGFIRQRVARRAVLPDKSGVPSRTVHGEPPIPKSGAHCDHEPLVVPALAGSDASRPPKGGTTNRRFMGRGFRCSTTTVHNPAICLPSGESPVLPIREGTARTGVISGPATNRTFVPWVRRLAGVPRRFQFCRCHPCR